MLNKVKITSYSLFFILIIILIFSLSLVAFEWSLDRDKKAQLHLHETKYYGNTLNSDPYKDFVVQYIHPYYMFSLPWQDEERNLSNNKFVYINNNGFRNIEGHNNRKILILGGSTAFGHFSTGNETTIGAYLNDLSPLGVVNRNAPSWNSHQEAVALFKYELLDEVDFSISLSLNNDMSIICYERDIGNNKALDFPESWSRLNSLVDDIRSVAKPNNSNLIKTFTLKVFPNSYHFLASLKKDLRNKEIISKAAFGSCSLTDADKVAGSFLSNQKRMSKIAKSYGFKHILIIQPMHITHNTALIPKILKDNEAKFKRNVIEKIMNSQYCIDNRCVDFSNLFDNKGFFLKQYGSISTDSILREKWFDSGIFVDNGHFNDRGNKIVANYINKILDDSYESIH